MPRHGDGNWIIEQGAACEACAGAGSIASAVRRDVQSAGEFIEELEVGGAGDRNVERIRGGMMPTNTGPFGKEYSKTWRRLHGM